MFIFIFFNNIIIKFNDFLYNNLLIINYSYKYFFIIFFIKFYLCVKLKEY